MSQNIPCPHCTAQMILLRTNKQDRIKGANIIHVYKCTICDITHTETSGSKPTQRQLEKIELNQFKDLDGIEELL